MQSSTRAAIALLFLALTPLWAADELPVYVETLPNPNDYTLFANGGWDGNWYVGSNACWVKKLPPLPGGRYKAVYLGVKLGRAKILSSKAPPWEKRALPGDIFGALSSTSAWISDQQVPLARTEEIPLEGDSESAINSVGESEWFWAPVKPPSAEAGQSLFAAVWSPTPEFIAVSSSPVIAAGWGGKSSADSWLLRDIKGTPPRKPVDLGSAISYFQPAIALKLIPDGPPHALTVRVIGWQPGTIEQPQPIISASVTGESVESAHLEAIPATGGSWHRVGRPLWKAPYTFTLDILALPPGKLRLRVVASNIWEETNASSPFNILVATAPTTTSKK